jgi:hypothetical protein
MSALVFVPIADGRAQQAVYPLGQSGWQTAPIGYIWARMRA